MSVSKLNLLGLEPDLQTIDQQWIRSLPAWDDLVDILQRRLEELRNRFEASYRQLIGQIDSVQAVGGMTDLLVEQRICRIYERVYKQHLETLEQNIRTVITEYAPQNEEIKLGHPEVRYIVTL